MRRLFVTSLVVLVATATALVAGQAASPKPATPSAAPKPAPARPAAPAGNRLLSPATLTAKAPEAFKVKFDTTKGVIALDVHPTALALAGAKIPKDANFDGVNLAPYLAGEKKGPPHEFLFWRYGSQAAVRKGDWKLVRMNNQIAGLFNLASDIGEQADLKEKNADMAKNLETAFQHWNAQLAKPLWVTGAQPAKKKKQP